MPLPTFVIVGAQKCGTTSLHRALGKHPQVHVSQEKELHFFDWRFQRGLEWYEQQFSPRWREKQVGEATPSYMFLPRARQRLIETLPDARIVVMLRNPVDRAYSQYWHDVRRGRKKMPSSFEQALAEEVPDAFADLADFPDEKVGRPLSYVGRGRFMEQVRPFADAYSPDRLHVMLLEDVVGDWEGSLRRVFDFLRVKPGAAREISEIRVNRYRQRDEEGKVRAASYEPMAAETRARLAAYYRPMNEELASWLGRDLAHWE